MTEQSHHPFLNPPPVAGPDSFRPPPEVDWIAAHKALEGLFALVGVALGEVFDVGLEITSERLTFTHAAPIAGVEPIIVNADDGDPASAEWGWPVTVTFAEDRA